MPVQQPKTDNTTNDHDRDRQNQVACHLTNRQSQAAHETAKHHRQRQGESDSSHGLATVLLAWEQPKFRVTSQIEMTNHAPKSPK
jgi:hypothetical protein